MQISIVTSLHNRLDLTRPFLRSLEDTLRGWDYEVILIDDASTDGTRGFLETLSRSDPRCRVILRESPSGFAANNNAGARAARAPLLGFLNNDLVLMPGWLEPMARLARLLPDVACVGNVQREPVSGLIDHHGFYFDADGNPRHAGKDQALAPVEPYLSWPAVTAACWVIRRKLFLRLGGFDESFRNGCEDLDFCLRAGSAGYRHFVANHSVVYHHISSSPGRKQHEPQNVRLFQERWRTHITALQRARETTLELRTDGWRYLRKHRARPWRYNFWRVLAALKKTRGPTRISRTPGWFARAALRLLEMLRPVADEQPAPPTSSPGSPRVYMVVSGTVQSPDRSGLPTFVRSLAGAFGRLRAPVRLVQWNAASRSLTALPSELSLGCDAENLRARAASDGSDGSYNHSLYDPRAAFLHDPSANMPSLHEITHSWDSAAQTWVLMPEILYGKEQAAHLADYVHRHGWRLALIFHDAIPVTLPALAAPGQSTEHRDFMHYSSGADLILPVSEHSARDWQKFVAVRALLRNPVIVCTPGADTHDHHARRPPPSRGGSSARVRVLCVSTVAARKNHRSLLAAYELAAAALPDLTLELCLVGTARPTMENIPGTIHEAMARHPGKIHWHEQADYSALRAFYEACDFTVYPSEVEGFALSVLESLWFGRPCVCADSGEIGAVAAGGGCLAVDVRNPVALADAIIELASSPDSYRRLVEEANARRIKTWNDYAAEILAALPVYRAETTVNIAAAHEPVLSVPAEARG